LGQSHIKTPLHIVFTRYILLSWQQRCNTDQRTLGGLFAQLADEINELDWAVALNSLVEYFTYKS
jgi:hypothetical protein